MALVVSFAFVPSVSARIFSSWSCEGYGDVDEITVIQASVNLSTELAAEASSGGRLAYYLWRDLGVTCYESAEHNEVVAVAILLMLLWPLGVQALYWLLAAYYLLLTCCADNPLADRGAGALLATCYLLLTTYLLR